MFTLPPAPLSLYWYLPLCVPEGDACWHGLIFLHIPFMREVLGYAIGEDRIITI